MNYSPEQIRDMMHGSPLRILNDPNPPPADGREEEILGRLAEIQDLLGKMLRKNQPEQLVSEERAAFLLGISTRTLRRTEAKWKAHGLQRVLVGERRLYRQESLDAAIRRAAKEFAILATK